MSRRRIGDEKLRKGRRQVQKESEAFEQMDSFFEELAELALMIEAAGSIDRAIQIGQLGADDVDLQALRQMVPRSRGGENDKPEGEQVWQDLIRMRLHTPEGRELFVQIQDEINRRASQGGADQE